MDSQTRDIQGVFVLKRIGLSKNDIHLELADDQSQAQAAMAIAGTLTNKQRTVLSYPAMPAGTLAEGRLPTWEGTLLLQAMHAAVTTHLRSVVDFFTVDAATPEHVDLYPDASEGLLLPTDELRFMAPMVKIHEYTYKAWMSSKN